MARILLLVAVFAMVATVATANIPDPALSVIPDMLTITPDGSYGVTFSINGAQGAVQGAVVRLEFSQEATGLIAWQVPLTSGDVPSTAGPARVYAKSADINGDATFFVSGGGCLADKNPQEPVEPYIVNVTADNFPMGQIMVNSPDAVTSAGQLAEDLLDTICEGGTTTVGLADALFITPCAKSGCPEDCSEFTPPYGDGVQLSDIGVFTPYAKAGTSAACTGSWQ